MGNAFYATEESLHAARKHSEACLVALLAMPKAWDYPPPGYAATECLQGLLLLDENIRLKDTRYGRFCRTIDQFHEWYKNWQDFDREWISLMEHQGVRYTIEASWRGDSIRPFSSVDSPAYATAHQASGAWLDSLRWDFLFNGEDLAYDAIPPLVVNDTLERYAISRQAIENLQMQIVSEWRTAIEWIGKRNSKSPIATSSNGGNPTRIGTSTQPETSRALQVFLDDGLDGPSALASNKQERHSGREPMRFDPRLWNRVASKPFTEDVDFLGEPDFYGRETLYCDESESKWIMIKERWTNRVDWWSDQTYRIPSKHDAALWAMDADCDLPESLRSELATLTLSPDQLPGEQPSTPTWSDDYLSIGDRRLTKVSKRAANLRPILDAFEEEGWPGRIDDPLPGGNTDPSGRLRDAIKGLNSKQGEIVFHSDGTGEAVCWRFHGSNMEENKFG